MAYLLGVDIGTGGARALLIREDGVPVASATSEYPLYQPYPQWAEQEPADWWQGAVNAIRGVLAESRVSPDAIKAMALSVAVRHCDSYIADTFHPSKTARMSPGSLADWPLPEQRPLFHLLGDPEAAIGVRLTDSFLMVPNKSVSGIRFPTEESFESCQLCPRPDCPNRRARYDAELFERRYKQAE